MPALSVVVVAHDSAGDLERTLPALAPQLSAGDELIVVDCASNDDPAAVVHRHVPAARVIAPGVNLGFAGGAATGARDAHGELLLFLNPDAAPEPGCLDRLRAAAEEQPTWGAWQALVLMADAATVNSDGNVAHWTGIGWAGGCDAPAESVDPRPRPVGFASGAALVVRRSLWERLGGFEPGYFMYGEDQDLSLRLRLAGWEVGIVPEARVTHEYEFEKGSYKWFHLERNRAWTVLSVYPGPLLLALAPALIAFELALLAIAARGGWLPAKLRAQAAVLRDLPAILRRRRVVQATRTISPAQFAAALDHDLDSPFLGPLAQHPLVGGLQRTYWRAARRLIG